jgi:hypothetical protein
MVDVIDVACRALRGLKANVCCHVFVRGLYFEIAVVPTRRAAQFILLRAGCLLKFFNPLPFSKKLMQFTPPPET